MGNDQGKRPSRRFLLNTRIHAPAVPTNHTGYTRTENNGDVYTFVFDRMGRQKQEKKVDSTPTTLYQQDFTYDKNGNRSTMQQQGSGAGITAFTYTYSYDAQGRMTQFTDSARNYTATVTADANGNITRVQEAWTGAPNNWRTDFTFDYENRLTQAQGLTVVGGTVVAWNTVNHSYDGLGRRLKTTAGGTNYGHIYDGLKLAGNRNLGTSTDGTAWVNAVNDARPLASLQIATTGATRYYSVGDERDPVRRTYTSGGTAGDTSQQSHYGQYELINGNAPVFSFYGPRGTKQSEVFPVRSLTFTENDVALPAERGNLEYAGLSLVYEGNRVKSALLGRDLNPLGRGDTSFYPLGALSLKNATPKGAQYVWTGNGNSVNNEDQGGIGSSPNGNFDAAQMLKCNQSLHPDRLCPLCPLLKINPCQWTTPDELCECIRQAACEAYQCWYNNPYCCENIYRFCSCMCGKKTDCLVSGCGDTSGVSREGSGPQCCGNGDNNGTSNGGGGGGCGGGGCGGPARPPSGNGGDSHDMPGRAGPGNEGNEGGDGSMQGATQDQFQNVHIRCSRRWAPLVHQALGMVLAAVESGCIQPCGPDDINNGQDTIKKCVTDFLETGSFSITCRWFNSQHRFGNTRGTRINIWISEIKSACRDVRAEDIAAAILHELIHMCLNKNGWLSSCCAGSVAEEEALALLCQHNCFPHTCLTSNALEGDKDLLKKPENCCGVCK